MLRGTLEAGGSPLDNHAEGSSNRSAQGPPISESTRQRTFSLVVQVRLARPVHAVATAQESGWSALSNGELREVMERAGLVLLTLADKNVR